MLLKKFLRRCISLIFFETEASRDIVVVVLDSVATLILDLAQSCGRELV